MNKSSNNSILSKFIAKEIEHIYNKYNIIPEEERNAIRKFIEKVEENSLDFEPYLNYNVTKAVAEVAARIEDIDLLRCYLFLKHDINLDTHIDDVKEAYRDLNDQGYCKIKGYYLYKNEETMKELAKDELEEKLEDAYEVASMFNIEEIADMWIFGTSKEEAARQYLRDNNWCDVIECEKSQEGYKDSYGYRIYYCYSGEE